MHGLVEKVGLRHVWVGPVEQREAVCVWKVDWSSVCVTAGSHAVVERERARRSAGPD